MLLLDLSDYLMQYPVIHSNSKLLSHLLLTEDLFLPWKVYLPSGLEGEQCETSEY